MYVDVDGGRGRWGRGEGGVSQDTFTARVNACIGEHDRRIE